MDFLAGYRRLIIGLFSLFIFFSSLHAAEDAFSLDKGFLWPDSSLYLRSRLISPSVFQNPSSLSFSESNLVIKADSSQDYFGYNLWSVSGLIPTQYITIGVGIQTFSADDIPQTSFDDSADYGVAVSDSLSDSINELRLVLSRKLYQNMSASFSFSAYYRDLVGYSSSSYSGDFGFSWIINEYVGLGVYSRHLFSTPIDWVDLDGIEDSFEKKGIVEAFFSVEPVWAKISSDSEYIRLETEFRLAPYLAVMADAVSSFEEGSLRQGYGVVLELKPMSFYYYHLNFSGLPLSVSQDQFGFSFQLTGYTR